MNDAVGEFHQQFNADNWSAIYDAADASFRAATPRETFVRSMAALKSNAGNLEESEQRSYVVQAQAGDNSGTFVRATYASKFAQKTATETFAWRIDGARALLFFYDAQ